MVHITQDHTARARSRTDLPGTASRAPDTGSQRLWPRYHALQVFSARAAVTGAVVIVVVIAVVVVVATALLRRGRTR